MQLTPNPRAKRVSMLTAGFLLLSAALSVLVLALRNLYDDEISSFFLVKGPIGTIFRFSAEGDVHPPGMYLLAHFAYAAIPSYRWMNLFPALVLYAGLAIFLMQIAPLLPSMRCRLCLLLLATLHPQLLMWSTTFRWYSWWTGIALITLTVALQPRESMPRLSPARAALLGVLLAALFYLNYITLLFALALAAAMLLRYRAQPWKRLTTCAAILVAVFFLLIAPQLRTMLFVHMAEGGEQRSGVGVSLLRLVQSIATSEAFLPWHPLALLAGLVFAALCLAGGMQLLRAHRLAEDSSGKASIVVFGLVFFVLVAVSGLGGKPRNGLILIPVFAVVAALILEKLHPRVQTAILVFFAIWSSVGIAHLLGRTGLTKASMNDRPDEVLRFIQQDASSKSAPACSVVVTYDMKLAFTLDQARLPRLLVVSPFRGYRSGDADALPPGGCDDLRLYVVQTYAGDDSRQSRVYSDELDSATNFFATPPTAHLFSLDPDARMKRRIRLIRGSEALPDYRYVVLSGTMPRARLAALRADLTYFRSGSDSVNLSPGD